MTLPSLDTSRRLRMFAFTSFYVAQGIPLGLVTVALPAWLASNGADAGAVGNFLAVATLPWAFKIVVGPLMDRFRFPSLGSRRPWVMAAMAGLLGTTLALVFLEISVEQIGLLTACCFVVNSFAAFQDVAVDGMAIEILAEEERGRANALMAFGQVASLSVFGAICGWTLPNLGMGWTAIVLSVAIAAILAIAVLVRERRGERLLPWTDGSAQGSVATQSVSFVMIGRNLIHSLVLPASIVLICVTLCWRVSQGILVTAAPVLLTQNFGWTSEEYASWISISTLVAATLGIGAGFLIDRFGSRALYIWGLVFCAAVFFALWLTAPIWDQKIVWVIAMFAANLGMQVVFVALIAVHMSICWGVVAATQFALYMAWANFARSIGAKLYGEIATFLEIGQEALLMGVLCLLSAGLVTRLNLQRHQARLSELSAEPGREGGAVDVPARY